MSSACGAAAVPLVVEGFFLRGHGLSAMARGLLSTCDVAGLPAVAVRASPPGLHARNPPDDIPCVARQDAPAGLEVDATTADTRAGRPGSPAPRVGLWAWEVADAMPPELASSLGIAEELWTLSEHCAGALRRLVDRPVRVLGVPVAIPDTAPAPLPRAALGLPEGFLVLATMDLASSVERKNPFGVIRAYRRAFGPRDGAALVLKTTNGQWLPERVEALRAAAAGRGDIHIVDERLPDGVFADWVASCDCYLSLHRAEGFGLGMAEAMARGRPVVATGYSGNLDFMDDASAYLVGWRRADVPRWGDVYDAGTWADPDLDHAAEQLRAVRRDPDRATAIAAAGRAAVTARCSPEATAARLRAAVDALHG